MDQHSTRAAEADLLCIAPTDARRSAYQPREFGASRDSAQSARGRRAVQSPHGAFEDPTMPANVLPRQSIELRTIAFHV
jgi:hypothetical protein